MGVSDDDDDRSEDEDEYDKDFIDDEDASDADSERAGSRKKRKKLKGTKDVGKKKKPKMNAGYFFEEEAEEDDEESEGSDDEVNVEERRRAEKERLQMEKDLRRRNKGPDFLKYEGEEEIEDYFKHNAMVEEGEGDDLANLPTSNDPKLFAVRVKRGEEREACKQIMQKYFECLGTATEFQVFSCTAIDKTKEYIYVEAYSDKHVYLAVANIPIIFSSKIKLVSLSDRTQIFEKDPTKSIEVKVGQWVRIKEGLYDGDLGQVVDLNEAKSRVTVRLVPRLALEDDEEQHEEEDKRDEGDKPKQYDYLKKARAAARNKIRPPQRLFQINEYQGWTTHRDPERGSGYHLYRNQRFYDGLLHKEFPTKKLVTENVSVTYDESKFFTIGDNSDPAVLSTLIDQAGNKPTKYFKGDKVRVVRGDLQNLEAEIVQINPTTLTVKPINTDLAMDSVEVAPYDCVKVFVKGDYVRVIEGKNAGKEGFVLSVEDNIATIMAGGLTDVIQSFVNDLVFCNESTKGIEIKATQNKELEQEYMKFDLIKLNDRKTIGIILGAANNGWRILDNFGNVRTVTALQIEQKLNTRNNTTRNDKSQMFKRQDSVRILQGKYKGETGIIKHIYNDMLFIYNPDVTQNMGIIIEKANNCFLLSSQRQPGGKAAGPKGGKDNLIGQKCFIKSGPWKGYQGIVKDGNEKTVIMELTTNARKLDVKRDLVMPLNDANKVNEQIQNKTIEPKTPMHSKYPQSPMFDPGASPNWTGFESPGYDAHMK